MTAAEPDALAALDWPVTCERPDCEQPANRTMHAFHLHSTGQGWDPGSECLPSRFVYCDRHAVQLARLLNRPLGTGERRVCQAHDRDVVVRWESRA